MSSKEDSTASTGSPEPTTPENPPIDLPIDSTPTVHKQSSARPYSTGHVMRDESFIALGNEILGYIVGLMPAEEFLELLPPTSKPLPVETVPFTDLADKKVESQMYDPFVRIPFSFFFLSIDWIKYFLDQGDGGILHRTGWYQYFQYSNEDLFQQLYQAGYHILQQALRQES